ncbi:MAG: zf-HC2 domain-containing protein [Candidatus Marinimicrobia bacterium]|nr:zf-HC2 domain-containing protein [Candidatus Neomarinimicrobiota bacterium]MCF7839990.1 zf-HC2 domain-containing protein [Candidatus Neomarinimicrobiota bacterium]MCF7902983.1 zf-HC2 domain-containing protein [Candidatus Neomarinimicrobiota bacterium]
MKCQLVLDSYTAYTDYELTATMRTQVEDHLKQCRPCREVFQGLDSMVASLHNMSLIQTSLDFNDRLLMKISKAYLQPTRLPWYRLPTVKFSGYATAAGVALALVFSQWMSPSSDSPPLTPKNMPVAEQTLPEATNESIFVTQDTADNGADTLGLSEPHTSRPDQPLQLVNQRP